MDYRIHMIMDNLPASTVQAPPLAVPELSSCASSGRAWRLWAASGSQGKRPRHWALRHRLGCSSQPPPKPLISPPLTIQALTLTLTLTLTGPRRPR